MENERTQEQILESFERLENGKYLFKLTEKIVQGSKEITEFELFKPKARHMRQMPSNPKTDDILKIIGALAAQPDSVIDELSISDMNSLAEFFGAFS